MHATALTRRRSETVLLTASAGLDNTYLHLGQRLTLGSTASYLVGHEPPTLKTVSCPNSEYSRAFLRPNGELSQITPNARPLGDF